MKTLNVELPGAAYPIHIGPNSCESHLPALVEVLARELVVIVTNETVAGLYPDRLAKALAGLPLRVETCLVPDGERYKNLETLSTIYDRLMELEANRGTVVIAYGGGVVGDMAGFAAATFMRGLPVIQVPTTLLAQVDSSVGGKTAVNHARGKNAIGAFKQPGGVVIDLTFLETLPPRELSAGLFELIKHGIIRSESLLAYLEDGRERFAGMDWAFWEEAIHRSCEVKAAVVEQDEKETDLRAILNFGHSLAHLIETHTGYETYLHGEAVGVGMLFAAYVSREWGLISPEAFARVRALLEPLATPIRLPPLGRGAFTELLMHDKKASRRTLKFILLEELGRACIREGTSPEELWPVFQGFLEEMPAVLRVGEG
jgi:3-dehydroquinate synthase